MQRCVCADIFGVAFLGFAPCQALRFYVIKKKRKKERIQRINLLLPLSPPPTPPGLGKGEVGVGAWNVGGGVRLSPPLPLL